MFKSEKEFHKVLFIQRRMVEYRVPFFEKLRESLIHAGVKLHIIYGSPTKSEKLRRDEEVLAWGIKIPCHYFSLGKSQILYQHLPKSLLNGQDLIIMPHENQILLNFYYLLKRYAENSLIAFFGHGANFQSRNPDSYREKLKSSSSILADWWFAYTRLSVERIVENGFPENRITCVNNSIDTSKLIEWRESIASDELNALRTVLGLQGNKIGIFIGTLHENRRLEFLFSAADELRRRLHDFELIIIGNGPLRNKVQLFVKERPWAYWAGALHGREKVLHMALGKVVLNPGLVGLNILDSFALGVPMITTDCKIHSPEIAYLQSGRNGLMVADSEEAFIEGVERLLKNDEMRNAMAAECKKDAQRYSLENMVDNFCEGILKALNQKPPPPRWK